MDDDRDYLEQLRADMADPFGAPVSSCHRCHQRFIFRCWPIHDDDQEVVDAMLAGLHEVAVATGLPVYGLCMVKKGDQCPAVDDLDARCQLWRPGDAVPLVDGPQRDALKRMLEHPCVDARWN